MDSPKFGFSALTIIKEGRVNKEDIDTLITWASSQQLPKITEEQMVLFLLSCQNNLEATKNTIKAFYSIRNVNPNIFTDRDLSRKELDKALQTIQIFTTFEKRTENGYAVVFGRLHDTYYGNFDLAPCVKALFMTMDAMIHDNPPNGFITLFDMKGVGFMHLTRLHPSVLLPFFRYIQEGLPTRLMAVHVLNSNYIVTALMKILTPFMNAELINKLHFHPPSLDMNHFYNTFISKSVISEEYGGDLPPVKQLHNETIKKLQTMQEHFEAEERQRCNFIKGEK